MVVADWCFVGILVWMSQVATFGVRRLPREAMRSKPRLPQPLHGEMRNVFDRICRAEQLLLLLDQQPYQSIGVLAAYFDLYRQLERLFDHLGLLAHRELSFNLAACGEPLLLALI